MKRGQPRGQFSVVAVFPDWIMDVESRKDKSLSPEELIVQLRKYADAIEASVKKYAELEVGPGVGVVSAPTPGPWGIERTASANWIGPLRVDGKPNPVVVCIESGAGFGPDVTARRDADARLIAAAPELLEALKALKHQAAQEFADPHDTDSFQQALAAIAKAEGQS